jgi:hypothetical protein
MTWKYKPLKTIILYGLRKMQGKISDNVKSLVIQKYLAGESRDDIARECGLAAGTVSGIIAEWKINIGQYIAEDLRDLGTSLKKSRITPGQCATGARLAKTLEKLEVNEDNLRAFISNLYDSCEKNGLTPQDVALLLKDLLEFLDKSNTKISLMDIQQYLEQKEKIKVKLENDIENHEGQKQDLIAETNALSKLRDHALKNKSITDTKIRYYSMLEEGLKKYGLLLIKSDSEGYVNHDIENFVQLVHTLKQYGYDVNKVLDKYCNMILVEENRKILNYQINTMKNQKIKLEQNCAILRHEESLHYQRLLVYYELERMGLGLNELNLLSKTINEIASENQIPYNLAIRDIFKLIQTRYGVRINSPFTTFRTITTFNTEIHDSGDISNCYY